MSDGSTFFKNETIRMLAKSLKVPDHFIPTCTPWSSGAVERLSKELLRSFREDLSKLRLDCNERPDLLPLIRSVISKDTWPARSDTATLTAFTGRDPTPPITSFLRTTILKSATIPTLVIDQARSNTVLQLRIVELYRLWRDALADSGQRSHQSTDRGYLSSFVQGDFVPVACSKFYGGEKLSLHWRGP